MRPLNEFRHAFRQLRHSPGYTTTAALTFAVAIGANSAIFSAVSAVLLQPLPAQAPGELAVVWQTDEGGQTVVELTYRHLREWTETGRTFTRAAVMGSHNWSGVLQQGDEPSRIWFTGVSAGFFETLGVAPTLGRGLRAGDDVPNAPPVAVLNHDAWMRRFGGNPGVVGTTMTLDGEPIEIVGVMPKGFDFPRGAEFWVPVVPILASGTPPATANLDRVGVFYVVGRVRAGLEPAAIEQEIDALEAQLDAADPGRLKWGARAVATPFLDHMFGPVRPALRVLWGAVAVLLLIACANVSGLMMTRISRRRRDDGIRLALGASRIAVGRTWMCETLIVASAGGVLGLILAQWLTDLIVALAPDDLPRVAEIAVDARVALFTFAVVAAVAVVAGALPVRQAGGASLLTTMEGGRATAGRAALRARATLLVAQIALSVVLLVAAGLVLRSFIALRHVDLGFAAGRVLSLTVQPRGDARPPNLWLRDFLERVEALPGVEAAGAVFLRPLMLGPIGQGARIHLEGQPQTREAAEANPTLNYQIASPGYFEALRIPLLAGRWFTGRDDANAPRVAIVSESTARRLWPGQDPIGRRVSMSKFAPGSGPPGTAWRTIVGVVSDVRYRGLQDVQLDIYDPALQAGLPADNVVVRASGDPARLAAAIRTLARDMDDDAIVDGITTLDAVVERAQAPWRLTTWMFLLFAGFAFGLAAVGLFSLVALDVAHRGREFAIRMTLGASGGAIVRGVLLRAGWLVTGGLALGGAAAVVAIRAFGDLLVGVESGDHTTYLLVFALVVTAVSAAAYLPARRAAQADPQALLRQG